MSIDPNWAWQPYRPDAKNPWNIAKAGHLYRRAGFSANSTELDAALADGPEKAVGKLLGGGAGQEAFERQMADLAVSLDYYNEAELRAWWLLRILQTPHPLQERLTLFWHNHFATSTAKVRNLRYMLDQNELLRRKALGSFRTMLTEISQRPGDDDLARHQSEQEGNGQRELLLAS